jgi:uncharacterized protein (DUF736 family)
MPIIGLFTRHEDESFKGFIRTLGFCGEVEFLPVSSRQGAFSPTHRIVAGRDEIGTALELAPQGEVRRLRVELNAPGFPEPVVAVLSGAGGSAFDLIWHRAGGGKGNEAA